MSKPLISTIRLQQTDWPAWLALGMAGLLSFQGFTTLMIICGRSGSWDVPDPLVGMNFRYVSLLAAICQLGAGSWLCFSRNHRRVALWLVLWLGLNFAVYRGGLWVMGWHHPFGWLHGLMYSLNISAFHADILSSGIIVLMIVGGGSMLAVGHIKFKRTQSAKMSCPACGGHVKFAVRNLGAQILCPHCAKPIKLRREENLKMSCFFCHGHIEFPAHALGAKMACPHCKMDITLKEPA
jgi:predicted RNA-binding Zn-ribbon protein involved in translation (DUF1610 family)